MIGELFGNYKITHKLGAGGQGTVYKAIDQKLGRTVVIKVLPAELTVKESNLKRFEREARLASALDHPNICTVFDMDEVNGVHYIAMQYVEGKNVRQLCNGRPLELESALRIGIQTADALASAHARGIIHRDIKSGNVMVTDSGQVKILDFGLAKLLDETAARTSGIDRTDLTEVGVPYGTATYAAPEQAKGDKVDARADIFSTGVLLYEMLTGTWPFRGKSTVDVRHAVIHDQPKPLAEIRPGASPVRLQQILDKALSKNPRDRYQKIDELRDELRKVLHDVASGAKFEETTAPRHLGGSTPVGRELNVDAVLSAGFIHVGERFRVNAQLLEVTSGEIIWSDRVDASADDIIAVQDEITRRIVDGLRLELSPDEQAGLAQPATVNAEAYDEFLRGRDRFARFIFRTVAAEDCDAAIRHFTRAIELDSEFGLAYDGLGAGYVNRVFKGLGGAEDFEKAESAFNRALQNDPNIAERSEERR